MLVLHMFFCKTWLPEGHAGFSPGRSSGGKNTVCAYLRGSAVNIKPPANPACPVKYEVHLTGV